MPYSQLNDFQRSTWRYIPEDGTLHLFIIYVINLNSKVGIGVLKSALAIWIFSPYAEC
jgi:hypothetical protein